MTALPILIENPEKAQNHMKTQMQFNESEINLIMKKSTEKK